MTVTDSTLSGNSAYVDGGGIYNGRTATVTDSTLSGNSANYYGGGVYNDGTLTITDSTVTGNSANYYGGGIYYVRHSDDRQQHHRRKLDDLRYGGGIFNEGTMTVTDSTLAGNSTKYNGGGIHNDGEKVTLTNDTLSGNSATGRGGGI